MNLSDLGEDAFYELVRDWTDSPRRTIELGPGDDGALLAPTGDRQLVVTTDAYREDVHFTRDILTPDQIGHRVMAGTLSDLAAMGADGLAAFLNLHAPADTPIDFLRGIYLGMVRVADSCGVVIAGGDTVRGELAFGITAIGTVPAGEAFRRDGARAGDVLCVSGELGRSEAGRILLSRQVGADVPPSLRRDGELAFQSPTPRFDIAGMLRSLARRSVDLEKTQETVAPVRPTSAIDVSDGLALDLRRLCAASHVGCRLEERLIPVSGVARAVSRLRDEPEITLALGGGEDYELLFTIAPADEELVLDTARRKGFHLGSIGTITPPDEGTLLIREDQSEEPLPEVGYDHFRRSEAPRAPHPRARNR